MALQVLQRLIQVHFEVDTVRLLICGELLLSRLVFGFTRFYGFLHEALLGVRVASAAFRSRTAQTRLARRVLSRDVSAAILLFEPHLGDLLLW